MLLAQAALLACFMIAGGLTAPHEDPNELGPVVAGLLGVAAMAVQNAGSRLILANHGPTTMMTGNTAKRWRDAAGTGSAPAGTAAPPSEDAKDDGKVAAVAPNAAAEPSKTETRSTGDPSLLRGFGPFGYDVVSVAFSPDGKRIYALVSGGYFMRLDPASGKIGAELASDRKERAVRWSSRRTKHLASGGYDDLALLWDAETGDLVRSFKGHSDHVVSVAFSPDGRRLVSGSYDGQSGFGTPTRETSCEASILALIRPTPSPFLRMESSLPQGTRMEISRSGTRRADGCYTA